MVDKLPRILLVTEATLSQEGKGVNRTLVNLFDNYPAELLMLFCPEHELESNPTSSPFDRQVLSFAGHRLPIVHNRLGKFLNPLINWINLQLLDWFPISNLQKLEEFDPEIILICPVTSLCLLMGYKLTQYFHCPSLIYFMDDWIAIDNSRWLSNSVQKMANQLLKQADSWLMISEQLQIELSNRYQIKPQSSLIVHNPVDLSDKQPPDTAITHEGTFKVVYAGSIWSMHYDALAAIAEAIFQLRCDGKDIELVLHTDKCFWNPYRDKWQQWEVTYGDIIPYQELNRYLQRADLLLVASSFLPEYAHMTRSSVQTKLTDYMAAGKPILACGPAYSACNQFLKNWKCGLVCETNRVNEIESFLIDTIQNKALRKKIAEVAFNVLNENFDKTIVTEKLQSYVKQIFSQNIRGDRTFKIKNSLLDRLTASNYN
ncbi:glycosyltransferase [Chroococcidiopsis sp. CCALA 051]|uniref:glycosyltransferase n=1 Tax=Chroococcidiopsis sp. CCALA 051 TaxID=869949 RepID=UPI0018EC822F|nr:glycosyltransferase [Chroococcidiopsis sp. CCALA 051]